MTNCVHSSIPTCQVSNAKQQPVSQVSHEEIKKNSIVALYAGDDEDNHGLPFFLGEIINVFDLDNSETDGDADNCKDDDKSDKASKYLVEIHEYIQTKPNVGEPLGKHQ